MSMSINKLFYLSESNIMCNGFELFNVKTYGALGNGVTDDTAAIQTTIQTAFDAGGGIVYAPTRTHFTTTNIRSVVLTH